MAHDLGLSYEDIALLQTNPTVLSMPGGAPPFGNRDLAECSGVERRRPPGDRPTPVGTDLLHGTHDAIATTRRGRAHFESSEGSTRRI